MSDFDWLEILGWDEDKVNELRMAAFSYIRQGKYSIAQNFFEALVILDPQNVYDQQTLGALFLQINDPIRALHHLEEAMNLDSNDNMTKINRVKALFMLGYREEALVSAKALKSCKDKTIADDAEALVMAYS